MSRFIDEISPLLKSIPKEAISEGSEDRFQMLDGTTSTMSMRDVEVTQEVDRAVEFNTDLDTWISMIHILAGQMVREMEQDLLTVAYENAEKYGRVYSAEELTVETLAQLFEDYDFTFTDDGKTEQSINIPQGLLEKYQQVVSDPKIQAIIERKRREFFAKKSD